MNDLFNLSGKSLELFNQLWREIEATKTPVMTTDRETLAAWCSEMHIYFELMEKVRQAGAVIDFSNGKQQMRVMNPDYKVAQAALNSARKTRDRLSHPIKILMLQGEDKWW